MTDEPTIQVATVAEMSRTIGVFCDEVTADEDMVMAAIMMTVADRIARVSPSHQIAYDRMIFTAAAIADAVATIMREKTGEAWTSPAR